MESYQKSRTELPTTFLRMFVGSNLTESIADATPKDIAVLCEPMMMRQFGYTGKDVMVAIEEVSDDINLDGTLEVISAKYPSFTDNFYNVLKTRHTLGHNLLSLSKDVSDDLMGDCMFIMKNYPTEYFDKASIYYSLGKHTFANAFMDLYKDDVDFRNRIVLTRPDLHELLNDVI